MENRLHLKKLLLTSIGTIKNTAVQHDASLSTCITPSSLSGQIIKICQDSVYKGPPIKWQQRHDITPSLRYDEKAMKIDFFTMNLLLQSAIRTAALADKRDIQIEYWESIVKDEAVWYMKSKKHGCKYTPSGSTKLVEVLSIEDYLKHSTVDDIGKPTNLGSNITQCPFIQGKTWFNQIKHTLKWAYEKLQMHHCDVKTAQMLITSTGEAVVSDMDKATFTLDIGGSPVRLRLNRREEEKGYKTTGKLIGHHIDERINKTRNQKKCMLLPMQLARQFESKPRKSCNYEVACYLSSYLLLVGGPSADNINGTDRETVNDGIRTLIKDLKSEYHSDTDDVEQFTINADSLIKMRKKRKWEDRRNYIEAEKHVEISRPVKITKDNVLFADLQSSVSLDDIDEMLRKHRQNVIRKRKREVLKDLLAIY